MDQNTVSVIVNAYSIIDYNSNCQTPGPFSTEVVGNHTHTMSTWTNYFESFFISLREFSYICDWNAQHILVTFPDCKTWTQSCQQPKEDLKNLTVIIHVSLRSKDK